MVTMEAKPPHCGFSLRTFADYTPVNVRALRASPTGPAHATTLDLFADSNTTGSGAETLGRRWLAFEKERGYLAASAFRFVDELPPTELATLWNRLCSDDSPVLVNRQRRELVLMEKTAPYAVKAKKKSMRGWTVFVHPHLLGSLKK